MSSAIRIVFMGSDPIALPLLETLETWDGVRIVGVYTQPDRPRGRGQRLKPNEIKAWALERDLPVRQPERLRKAERLALEAIEPDLVLAMAYGHLLSQKLIEAPPLGTWNFHTSLLPRYRGASPIQGAVASGDMETGVSLMRMVRKMDAGPVLDAERVRIDRLDTAQDVEGKLARATAALWRRHASKLAQGAATPLAQDETAATYTRKLRAADAGLDFSVRARDLAKRINALWPWPGARFELRGQPLKVGLADWSEASVCAPPGEVVSAGKAGLSVACGAGSVAFLRLQRPGGKMLDAEAFLRGFPISAGQRLTSRPMGPLVANQPFESGTATG